MACATLHLAYQNSKRDKFPIDFCTHFPVTACHPVTQRVPARCLPSFLGTKETGNNTGGRWLDGGLGLVSRRACRVAPPPSRARRMREDSEKEGDTAQPRRRKCLSEVPNFNLLPYCTTFFCVLYWRLPFYPRNLFEAP
jgi:hypothetical protein